MRWWTGPVHGTASHLERIVRAYSRVLRNNELRDVNERHARRSVHTHYDEDGSFVLVARLDPKFCAVTAAVLAAIGKAACNLHGAA